MKTISKLALSLVACCLLACSQAPKEEKQVETESNKTMNNLISIVEIPVNDFARAKNFYQIILNTNIEQMEMDGNTMGVFPNEAGEVSVVLIKGKDYKPTTDGAMLYLNAGKDLQVALNKITENGGEVLLPKTLIDPQMGYYAVFLDTEGNKIGLHSAE